MSGVVGLLSLDGAPVDARRLDRMCDAVRRRGPDGSATWTEGPVGLARSHLWTTPEEIGEAQPLAATDDRFRIVTDARLDNREELAAQLRDDIGTRSPSDAQLILAAYRRWGEDCPRHLVGDFAFLLWDARDRRLVGARDPLGVRLLHYCQIGETLVAATSVAGVLAGLDSRPPVNTPLIRDLLSHRFTRWVQETAYETIFRVPPGYRPRPTGAAYRSRATTGSASGRPPVSGVKTTTPTSSGSCSSEPSRPVCGRHDR